MDVIYFECMLCKETAKNPLFICNWIFVALWFKPEKQFIWFECQCWWCLNTVTKRLSKSWVICITRNVYYLRITITSTMTTTAEEKHDLQSGISFMNNSNQNHFGRERRRGREYIQAYSNEYVNWLHIIVKQGSPFSLPTLAPVCPSQVKMRSYIECF